jgi:hypothetical protein
MKKLGVVGDASPCVTIDHFFPVVTSGPRQHYSRPSEACVYFLEESRLPDATAFSPVFGNICPMCQSILLCDPRFAQVVCRTCGESCATMFSDARNQASSAPSMQQHVVQKRITTYMYKRTNHFLDHLKRVQAKESTSIPPAILNAVQNELLKEGIAIGNPRVTTTKVRSILKKLRLQKFYNHVFAITSHLSGRDPPHLTPMQEEKLLAMFQAIQGPFQRHCPPERTNMISYSYVLRKLVQILGWTHLIDYFPLLKSRHKVYSQDCIWRNICDEVGFPFHRSIA